MNCFSSFSLFNIMTIVIGTYFLLNNIFTVCCHGKFIIKVKDDKVSTIFFSLILIFWCILIVVNTRRYIHHNDKTGIDIIISNIFCMELTILSLIKSLRSSQIRENGIYKSGHFYKWSKFLSYSWLAPNTIEFKVRQFFKTTRSFEITIKEEFKLKVDEVIQRNLIL